MIAKGTKEYERVIEAVRRRIAQSPVQQVQLETAARMAGCTPQQVHGLVQGWLDAEVAANRVEFVNDSWRLTEAEGNG